jgi:hypothetical protein
MQTLFLVALGLLCGSAVIAGAVYLAGHAPGLFKKPIIAAPRGVRRHRRQYRQRLRWRRRRPLLTSLSFQYPI